MNKKMLFAFPYAFGGASIYYKLQDYLHKDINIVSVNYPGHESRYSERLLSSIQQIAEDAYNQICDKLDNDYSLLGYSMGGYICYELYHVIKRNNKRLPKNIFVFATNEPGYKQEYKNGDEMDLAQIRETLNEYGATSEEVLNNDAMIDIIAPIVRKDTSAIENYIPTGHELGKIKCPVTIIRGSNEENTENCQDEWNKYFDSECEYIEVDGGHFFMFENDGNRFEEFAQIINARIIK